MQHSIIPVLLSKINIAKQGHFTSIKVDLCNMTLRLLDLFEEIGAIRGYQVIDSENRVKVSLRYVGGSFSMFYKISQVSRPGKRVYVNLMQLVKLKEREGGTTVYIISTQYGIFFDSECMAHRVGGEVLIKIVM